MTAKDDPLDILDRAHAASTGGEWSDTGLTYRQLRSRVEWLHLSIESIALGYFNSLDEVRQYARSTLKAINDYDAKHAKLDAALGKGGTR